MSEIRDEELDLVEKKQRRIRHCVECDKVLARIKLNEGQMRCITCRTRKPKKSVAPDRRLPAGLLDGAIETSKRKEKGKVVEPTPPLPESDLDVVKRISVTLSSLERRMRSTNRKKKLILSDQDRATADVVLRIVAGVCGISPEALMLYSKRENSGELLKYFLVEHCKFTCAMVASYFDVSMVGNIAQTVQKAKWRLKESVLHPKFKARFLAIQRELPNP